MYYDSVGGRVFAAGFFFLLAAAAGSRPAAATTVTGQLYDASSGTPVRGAALQVHFDAEDVEAGALVPAAQLAAGQQGQVTGVDGRYRFDLLSGRKYRLTVITDATGTAFPSNLIPPRPGFAVDSDGDGLVVSSATPAPPGGDGADRSYFLRFDVSSAAENFRNNHIPLDAVAAVVDLDKRADRPAASLGDVIHYTITVVNRSNRDLTAAAGRPVYILDSPDRGLSYLFGHASARLNNVPVDVGEHAETTRLRLIELGPFDLAAGAKLTLRYQVAVGVDTRPGSYRNRAVLTDRGGVELSAEAVATVQVRADAALERGVVVGRVFCDDDGDGRLGRGESGVMGARVYVDSGSYSVTDSAGFYHLSRVGAGSHVVKVDVATLAGGRLTTASSRLLRLTSGLSARANFGVACARVAVDTRHPRAQVVRAGAPAGAATPVAGAPAQLRLTGNLVDFTVARDGEPLALPSLTLGLTVPARWLLASDVGVANLAAVPAPGYLIDPPAWRPSWVAGMGGAATGWTLVISRAGVAVRTITGAGAPPAEISWDGLDDGGKALLGDELCSAQIEVVAGAGKVRITSARQPFAVAFGAAPAAERRVLAGSYFAGTAARPTTTAALDELIASLAAELGAGAAITVESHWDGGGDRLEAIARTQREAKLVAALLVAAGVDAARITARGRGSLEAIDAARTKAARQRNRRLVLVIARPPSPNAGARVALPTGRASVRVNRRELSIGADSGFAHVAAPGQLAIDMVAADGRRVVLELGSPAAGGAARAPLPETLAETEPTPTLAVVADIAAARLAVGAQRLPAGLFSVDVTLPTANLATRAVGDGRALVSPMSFSLHAPAPLVSSWELFVRDATGAEVYRVGAGAAGLARHYSWDGIVAGELALESGKHYTYQLVVTHAAGHRGYSPVRQFVVDGVAHPADWSAITATGALFSGRGGLRASVKNALSGFAQRVAGRAASERYVIAARAKIRTASVTERRLAVAARKTALRRYVRRLGVADERCQIEVEVADVDAMSISAIVPMTVVDPAVVARALVNGKQVTMRDGRFTATVAAGQAVAVDVTIASGQRATFSMTAPAPALVAEPTPAPDGTEVSAAPPSSEPVAAGQLRVYLPAENAELASRELAVLGETAPGNRIFIGVDKLGEVAVAGDGKFSALVTLPVGMRELTIQAVDRAGNRALIKWPVKVAKNHLFVVAHGEGIASLALTKRGWLADHAYLDGMNQDSVIGIGPALLHIRAAAYIKARFEAGALGSVEVTGHVDSAKLGGSAGFFADVVDPDSGPGRDQVAFGDSAAEVHDANARGKIYLEVKARGLAATVGSVHTDLSGGDLFRYDRTVSGARVDVSRDIGAHHIEVESVASSGNRELARDINWYRATGGTLYYLRHSHVLEGSEQVRVVTRDRDSGMKLGERRLTRNRDYRVDYDGGRIMFVAPVASVADTSWVIDNFEASSTPLSGHPLYIEVRYEHQDPTSGDGELGGVTLHDTVGGVTFGGGVVVESRPGGDDYSLWGADVAVRLGERSRVSAEVAGSWAEDGANYISQDGGMSFLELSGDPVADASAVDIGWKLAGEVHLGDFLGAKEADAASAPRWRAMLARTRMAVTVQNLDSDFSAGGSVLERGRLKVGALVVHQLNDHDQLRFRHLAEVAQLPRVGPTPADVAANPDPLVFDERATYLSTLQWARKRGRWRHQVEAAYQRLSSTAFLADGSPAIDARRLGLGGATSYSLSKWLTVRAGQQLVLGLADEDPWLNPITPASSAARSRERLAGVTTNVGADWHLTGDVAVGADWFQRWNGDNAGQVGLKSALGRGSMYVRERVESLSAGLVSTTIIGAEDRFGSAGDGRTYGEYQIENGVLGARNRAVLGLGQRWRVARGLRVSTGFEHQQVFGGFLPDGTPIGDNQRNILHGGAEYTADDRFKATAHLEVRFDEGLASGLDDLLSRDPRAVIGAGSYPDHGGVAPATPLVLQPGDALQLITGIGAAWRLPGGYTLIGRMRLAHTGARRGSADFATTARYSEVTSGVAYRPVANDWLNVLARYSYVGDMRPAIVGDQLDNRSHIFALIPLAELSERVTLAGKVAIKRTHSRNVANDMAADITASLVLARLGYRLIGRWDASGEARWLYLDNPNGDEARMGSLWELGYRLSDWVRFGVGYNLSRFSDNEFDDLARDSHGFFIRVTGQY